MAHKEVFAIIIAVAAVFLMIGIFGALRQKKAEKQSQTEPVISTTQTHSARTTSYWEYMREKDAEEAAKKAAETTTNVTTDPASTDVTNDGGAESQPAQTDVTENTDMIVQTEHGEQKQEVTTATSAGFEHQTGYTLVIN